jgi:hypothetical protein
LSELKISSELSLPREAATWVFAYLAKRGAGKTYNASVQAEEMLKDGIPIVVIDGMGIWWGLRVSSDGRGEGLPVVVFGGEHADLPLNPEQAAEMARAIVESNISCVLDLSSFAKYTARKIVAAFLNELYRLNRVERHVFIEETDLWAPQRPIGNEEQLCLSAVDNFVRRGGNHNLGCTMITQRSAVLNKDILTQSDCLVVLRTLAPQDKKAIQAWVEEQTDEDKDRLKVWYDSLKNLENGEAWVWHPEKPAIFVKVKYRQRETFHATREFIKSPQAAHIKLMNVSDFISKFKSIFERSSALTHTVNAQKPVDNAKLEQLQKKIELLEADKKNLQKLVDDAIEDHNQFCEEVSKLEEKLASFEKFAESLAAILPKNTPATTPADSQQIGLHRSVTVVDLETIKITLPKVMTDTVKGKLLTLAKEDFFSNWKSLSDVQARIDELAWGPITSQAVNGALNDLVKDGVLGMRHTDRNRWKLAPYVVFEGKKETEP